MNWKIVGEPWKDKDNEAEEICGVTEKTINSYFETNDTNSGIKKSYVALRTFMGFEPFFYLL